MKISNILRTDKTLDFSFYIIGWVCLILAFVLGLAWKNGYFLWIFPPDGCTLHNLTGYYCPGCGGTRAIHALLHGHIMRSFFYHPIVVYTAVFFGWFMLSQTIEKASRGRFAIGMHYRDIYLWIALAIVLLNWLVKNLVLAVLALHFLDKHSISDFSVPAPAHADADPHREMHLLPGLFQMHNHFPAESH